MRPEPNGLDAENINSETPIINAPPYKYGYGD